MHPFEGISMLIGFELCTPDFLTTLTTSDYTIVEDFVRIDLVGVDFVRIDLVGAPHQMLCNLRCQDYYTFLSKQSFGLKDDYG